MSGLAFLKKAGVTPPKLTEETTAAPKVGLSALKKTSSLSSLKTTTALTPTPDEDNTPSPDAVNAADKYSAPKTGGLSFLKTGSEAKAALAQEEVKQAAQKAKQGKMFEFHMADNEERRITFLDGDLTSEGILNIPLYHEHGMKVAGKFETFICTGETDESQPCPMCAAGEKRYLAGLMTVIDHNPYIIQNGPKKGTTVVNQRKLFKCKQTTLKTLTKIANKRGGLTGATFDVSRSGDMSAAVGNLFEFDSKWESRAAFANKFSLKDEDAVPADYSKELTYYTPEELVEMGIGKGFSGVGVKAKGTVDSAGLKSQL